MYEGWEVARNYHKTTGNDGKTSIHCRNTAEINPNIYFKKRK